MKIRLKPINPKRISDQVFDQLRELIFRGDFQPGQKIMTERELAKALNVSRNSVREAINKLVTLRFLEQRQGQGTFVRSMDEAVRIPLATVMETQDASLIDLMEMRMGIECNAASLAALRANADDLEAIEKAIVEMDTDTRSGGLGTEGDLSFHMAIASATKNPLQIYIMKNVSDFLHVGIRENLLHLYQDPDNIVEILRQHQAIYRAIRSGDAEAAYTTMRNHINYVIRFFKNFE
ncbi:GntR family transcriptional regulator [Desulfosarcina alkanivorans]|uniref:Pyruvate dehydrogenase complex repressor n=1 Tax=Desulfosarcina alkanivorans TaxID=571177 RepID=A0A5K7Z0Y0_9BACT|nr:FadR/GntR family transcriptional regulator [Desulfosarcina alkanivorans]BBO70467.1 GntR family transcriptional regulator [Desulfosarcina alkanivorans]